MCDSLLIVDDHPAARAGLTELAGPLVTGGIETAGDGEAALEQMRWGGFDLVMLDVRLPDTDGLAVLETMKRSHPSAQVVMISAHEFPVYVARAAIAGAEDYVLKNLDRALLGELFRRLSGGLGPLPGGPMARVVWKLRETAIASTLPDARAMTVREVQVLRHIAFGLSNREISKSLGISVETVKEHVQKILRKTGAGDRTSVAVRAVRAGWID